MNPLPGPKVHSTGTIHPDTRIGMVHLAVANLERQLAFYQDILGFKLHWRKEGAAGLGAGGPDLLQLTGAPGARRVPGTTGLYHFAILFPDRRELARAIARLLSIGYPNYPTDHVITKTTYLDDPEGQKIELYAESPEDGTAEILDGRFVARHADGRPSNGREPLDLDQLFQQLRPEDRLDEPIPPRTAIGHVHLYVADLAETMRFYHEVLGFDNMGLGSAFRMGMVSAGGYHHHIGFNTWTGEGAPPPPPGSLGLRYFAVVLPDPAELDKVLRRILQAGVAATPTEAGVLVKDPSQNGVLLVTESR
jgi:catechol 2,3-dioxygenase